MMTQIKKFNFIHPILFYYLFVHFLQINLNQLPFIFQIIDHNVFLHLNINEFS